MKPLADIPLSVLDLATYPEGGTVAQARIFAQEESRFLVSSGVFMVATGMVGPTIITHGSR